MKYSLVIALLLTSTLSIAQNSAGPGGTSGAAAGSGPGNSAGAGSRPISGVNNRNEVQGTTSSGVGVTTTGVGTSTTGSGTGTMNNGNSINNNPSNNVNGSFNGTGNLNNNTNFNNANNTGNSIYPQNNGIGGSNGNTNNGINNRDNRNNNTNQVPTVRSTGRTGVVSDGTTTTNLGTGIPQNNGPLVNNPGSNIAGSVTDMPTSIRRVRNTTAVNCVTSNGRTLSSRDSGYTACVNSSRNNNRR